MEFLRRLLGVQSASPADGLTPWTIETREDAVLDIVGEQSYQTALHRIGAPFDEEGPSNRVHTAELHREPTNRYDRNAVRVDIAGQRVGYLSRENALAYGPVLRWAEERGRFLAVRAGLTGGWDRGPGDRGSVGVKLNLGSPVETWLALAAETITLRTDHRWTGRLIAFTGDSTCRVSGMLLDRGASEALAARAGMSVHPRVTKQVELLVDCDPTGASGNEQKALAYGIEVVSELDFWAEIGLGVDGLPWAAAAQAAGATG